MTTSQILDRSASTFALPHVDVSQTFPKVSVIIPVYNVEDFIASTIQSVLDQTFQDFEIIVVIDGSPDNSLAICQQFSDRRIHIVEQDNRGLAGARNAGIRHATGNYIAFLDGDDVWTPQKLEKHMAHLDSQPEIGVSFSRSQLFGGNSAAYLMSFTGYVDAKRLLCRNPISNGSTPVVRREVLEEVKCQGNYFDEQFRRMEDIDLWLRIACLTNWKFEGLPEALTCYRVNAAGLSASYYRQFDSWLELLKKTATYAPDLIAKWERLATGYQYRALAQKAVMIGDGKTAFDLANRALTSSLGILAEPRGTVLTVLAAYLLRFLPQSFFKPLLKVAFSIRTLTQSWQIQREQQQATVHAERAQQELQPVMTVQY
ncbi:MAG: glycosyltransferase family 2 protein [Synechococcus sp.]